MHIVSVVDPSYAGGSLQIGTKRKYEDMAAVRSDIFGFQLQNFMCVCVCVCVCVG